MEIRDAGDELRILPIAPAQFPRDIKPEIKIVARKIGPEIELFPAVVSVAAAGHQAQVGFRQLADARIGKRRLHLADEAGFVRLKFSPKFFSESVAQRRARRLREAQRSVCRGQRCSVLLPALSGFESNPRPCRRGQFVVGPRALFQFEPPRSAGPANCAIPGYSCHGPLPHVSPHSRSLVEPAACPKPSYSSRLYREILHIVLKYRTNLPPVAER